MQVLFEVTSKLQYRHSMMRLLLLLISMVFISLVPVHADEVKSIRFGDHPNSIRIVMDMTGDMNFAAAMQDNPKRLEIYTPVKDWQINGNPYLKPPFTSIRHEAVPADGLSKIALTMDAPYRIRNAYMLPADSSNPQNRLVIDVEPVPLPVFESVIGVSQGTLAIAGEKKQDINALLQSISTIDSTDITTQKPQSKPVKKPIIVIDAGHGGQDPGAISPGGIREKNITLSMAKTIADILNKTGRYDARLTRSTDVYIKLYDRVKIARHADADLFISIHADSVGNENTKGASIYTLSNTASDKQTAKLAARENRSDIIAGVDLDDEDPDVSMILLDLSMRETMNQSKSLANTVVQSFTHAGVGTLKGPHRYAGFAVLKAPDVPSILIETGFVSNEAEAKQLLSKNYQNRIGNSLLKSLDQYFAK